MPALFLAALLSACASSAPPPTTDLPTPTPPPPPATACSISVVDVLSDDRFRGYPDSPSRQATFDNQTPAAKQRDIAESHGASYRQCVYVVTVNGQRYRWTATSDTTFEDKADDWCAQAQAGIGADVYATTQGCSDLHRGAYWGQDLVPLDDQD